MTRPTDGPVHIDIYCVFCEHSKRQHVESDVCTGTVHPVFLGHRSDPRPCDCEQYVNPADLCAFCLGTGTVEALDGLPVECRDCLGAGYVTV